MDTTMNRDGAPSLMEFSAEPAWNSCEGRKLPMIQRVEEQGGRILLYLDPPPVHLDVVELVVVVAHQRGRILYARWREDGCWTLPSGRVEHGETPEEAARRELLEETGATLKQFRVLCYALLHVWSRILGRHLSVRSQ